MFLGTPSHLKTNNKFKRDYKQATMMTVQDRASNIQEMFEKSSKDSTFTEFLGNWNMKMDPKLVTLQGKVLTTNTVVFAGGKE